jgi:hypothetical protein
VAPPIVVELPRLAQRAIASLGLIRLVVADLVSEEGGSSSFSARRSAQKVLPPTAPGASRHAR